MKHIKYSHDESTTDENSIAVFAQKISPVADTLIPFTATMNLNENGLHRAKSLIEKNPGSKFSAEVGPYFLHCKLKKCEGNQIIFEAIAFTKD